MDVFNKLCNTVSSTVSSTVSQLNSVLPGNPVTREYEATKLIGSAGPGNAPLSPLSLSHAVVYQGTTHIPIV